jgi:uroporphyrinogen-III synthase
MRSANPQNELTVLSTRYLAASLIRQVSREGIRLDCIPFIEIRPIVDAEIREQIRSLPQSPAVIFTSKNAVRILTGLLEGNVPEWKIFCTAGATRKAVAGYFGEKSLVSSAEDAEALADIIIQNRLAGPYIFFCGRQRLDLLPGKLTEKGISFQELAIYDTVPAGRTVDRNYTGILFFSPSAVQSFFTKNQVDDRTILFTVGETTADAVRKLSPNTLISARSPSEEALMEEVIEFFKRTSAGIPE